MFGAMCNHSFGMPFFPQWILELIEITFRGFSKVGVPDRFDVVFWKIRVFGEIWVLGSYP